MPNLTVGFIQQEITPNQPHVNLAAFAEQLSKAQHCELVILPEVFTTGFCSTARNFFDVEGGVYYQWLAEQAKQINAVITGSIIVKQNNEYFNRLVWMRPDGSYEQYNKRHLFRMAGEHERYVSGDQRLLVELNGWRIFPQICYDLRFPVWSRNRNNPQEGYDLAFYVANWPSARALHWNRLLQARAIENLSFVVGVNRIGHDEIQQHYAGDSAIYGPAGEVLLNSEDKAGLFSLTLSADDLQNYRNRFPAHLDADDFSLNF